MTYLFLWLAILANVVVTITNWQQYRRSKGAYARGLNDGARLTLDLLRARGYRIDPQDVGMLNYREANDNG